ncbi:hypothetical protein MIND_00925600 [Mycena indigotica]|uniref:Glycoside hydrolase family 71 protein n=1 Tax=Mycena indigotica TaxID=2126181 RepID=A0A8H6SCI5_9AGAR|nr:uncharacterized protein MIND_00925300 [Mycena indigotica]XP_037217297.1 uncharacterized protein MIND_00925600 [Mycena indigotica]KAF7296935.1 hypothetical protein MIND_00925300 [Mycena indigotica]KAF7296938.1 hypothetical protein MIND_00925600 [Mycena indigotica]
MVGSATLALLFSALHLASGNPVSRQSNSPKAVYAHFMVGIVENFSLSDWITEMTTAKSIGIDGFALNCAPPRVDSYTPKQLANAYNAAQQIPGGFTVFPSFDFAYWSSGDLSTILEVLRNYSSLPSQALYNGRPIVSTFVGDTFDWNSVRGTANVFAIPNIQDPGQILSTNTFDGAFSWYGWPEEVGNTPVAGPMTTKFDLRFINNFAQAGKGQIYMMPVSPWFSTHFPSKNWIFDGDTLITDRWPQVLSLQPPLVEIITWNDFGESHYISDSEPTHSDDGSSAWATGYPHAGWRIIMKAYIAAYKSGASDAVITDEQVVYWYRGFPKNTPCSGDTLGVPNGVNFFSDSIFITTLLKSPATLTVTSGSFAPVTINVPAGVTTSSVNMGIGSQKFSISRNGVQVASGTGGLDVKNTCTGVYNYNAYVGNFAVGPGGGGTGSSSSSASATKSSSASSSTSASRSSSASSSVVTSPPSSSSSRSSATSSATCGAGCTITASSQIFPTNCLQPGCVWAGPAGQGVPDHCDTGGRPCPTN